MSVSGPWAAPTAFAQDGAARPAGEALLDMLETGEVPARRTAAYALWQLGDWDAAGALRLVAALSDDDAYVRTTSARALGKQPHNTPEVLAALGQVLTSGAADVRLDAAKLLWSAGPGAEGKPIDALIAALGDPNPDVRANAAAGLEWETDAGAAAVAPLRALVADDDTSAVRVWAARALGSIDADALVGLISERAAPGVERALRIEAIGMFGYARMAGMESAAQLGAYLAEDDAGVREAAARALGAIGPGPAVDALVAALDDESAEVRAAALASLNNPGTPMQAALPRLIELIDSEDVAVRTGAAVAVVSIDPDAAEERLAKLLREDPDPNVRLMGAHGLSAMGPRMSDESVAAVIAATEDTGPGVVDVALQTIFRLGVRGAPAADAALARAADPEFPFTRQWGLLVLPKIGVPVEKALPVLVAALDSAQPMIVNAASSSIGEYGAAAASAAPRLAAIVRSNVDATVRSGAAMALGKLGPAAGEASEGLLEQTADAPYLVRVHTLGAVALTRPEDTERCVAGLIREIGGDPVMGIVPITGLGLIGPSAKAAVPWLRREAARNDRASWSMSALALCRIGGGPPNAALDPLLAGCASEDSGRRMSAFNALGELPAFAEQSVPALVAALDLQGTEHRVLMVLEQLGPAAASSVDALVRYSTHEAPAIRHAARNALIAVRGR